MVRRAVLAVTGTVALAVAAAVFGAGPAAADSKVTGTLSKPGYTVVAVAMVGGRTVTASAAGKAFSLTAPASTMTLHLVAPDGSYAGPLVVGTTPKAKGRKAILGVKAGARLGRVLVKAGFAVTKKPLPKASVVARRVAPTTRSGAPIGAAGYGLVAGTARAHPAVATRARPAIDPGTPLAVPAGLAPAGPDVAAAGEDADVDGLPNTLDIDANGNGVIDQVDPAAPPVTGLQSFVNYFAGLDTTVNVNADPNSGALIDTRMTDLLELVFLQIPAGAQLDCLGLSWCSPGGTGQIRPYGSTPGPNTPATTPFPDCCDPTGSGYGDIYRTSQSGPGEEFRLFPRATSAQIATGDTLVMRVPQADGTVQEIPGTIGFVFNTVPAVSSWSIGGASQTLVYPAAAGSPGTNANPWPIGITDPKLTLTFWRPQRPAITGAGEPAGYMDIGGLRYDVQVMLPGQSGNQPQCAPGALSTTDPNLAVQPNGGFDVLVDKAVDAVADPANTLSFTLDLGACAAGKGVTLGPGSMVNIGLEAFSAAGGDHVVQDLYFRVQ